MKLFVRLLLLPPLLLLFALSLMVCAVLLPYVPWWAYLVGLLIACIAVAWWLWGRRRPIHEGDPLSVRDRFDSTGKGLL